MHGGSGNHGCEAIVRTTAELLEGPKDIVLWSWAKEEDLHYGTATLAEKLMRNEELTRFSAQHIEAMLRYKLLKQQQAYADVFVRELFKNNIAISVGGDNYCYPWSAQWAVDLSKKIRKVCKYTVLWGCSIDEEAITPEVWEDLAAFDLITAREPLTYALLKEINPNTVQVADPAFLLDTVELPLPEAFSPGNTVGINVSPLIAKYGEGSVITENYRTLIRYILENTDMHICLIPHVIWENNDDRVPLKALYEEFCSSRRVCIVDDHNAMELKGYIARCRFFVGARTHATIAAYSSCVPTLVTGYSVKARGIALDLFGTDENYVVPVQSMQSAEELTEAFRWLYENEDNVRNTLEEVMPTYTKRARTAKDYFAQMLNK